MPANLIAKDKIRQLADTAAGLNVPGGDPRLKAIMARLLNDLFVAIDDLDISMDEVWAAVAYLTKAAPEYGLIVPGIGLERFLDMRLDEAERLAGLNGGTPRAIEGPLYVPGAPVSANTKRGSTTAPMTAKYCSWRARFAISRVRPCLTPRSKYGTPTRWAIIPSSGPRNRRLICAAR